MLPLQLCRIFVLGAGARSSRSSTQLFYLHLRNQIGLIDFRVHDIDGISDGNSGVLLELAPTGYS
jgi:hypothetical protein